MFVVILPSEYADMPNLFGPFRSFERATAVAAKWTAAHPDDPASVIEIHAPRDIDNF